MESGTRLGKKLSVTVLLHENGQGITRLLPAVESHAGIECSNKNQNDIDAVNLLHLFVWDNLIRQI